MVFRGLRFVPWFAWQLVYRRDLHKLAVRNIGRRPSETVLVMTGSLLGTALIAGSFIVGDTLDASIRASATTQLGPVDEVVVVPDPAKAADVEARIAGMDDPRIDGVISLLTAPASIASGQAGSKRAEPDSQLIEVNFEAARTFGGDPDATGIQGSTPTAGDAVITEDLADTLEAGAGDRIIVYAYGSELRLDVARVLPRLGLAGFQLAAQSTSPNAFVAPGTIQKASGRNAPPGAQPPQPTVAISNRGGVEEGAARTGTVTTLVEDVLGETKLRVQPVKREVLDAAEAQGQQFGELFLAIGAFAIVAGILLLVNIFVMLADERKSQLGMLRAIGMRRADLVAAFSIEGAFYSLAAAALGAVLGIAVGWAIVQVAAPIFSGAGDFSLHLIFTAEPASVITGFWIGLVISLLTVVFTSVRISRINIIRAIRDLPEPKVHRTRAVTVVAGIFVAVLATFAFVNVLGDREAWLVAMLAPPLAAFGLLPLIGALAGRRAAVLLASGLTLVWGIFGNTITNGQFFESGDIFTFVLQGVMLTFAAVVFGSQLGETFEGGIRRVAAEKLALRLSIAYPLARRFRTGLTLGMYALVMFTMVFIATMSNLFGGQVDTAIRQESGGFELLVTANESNPPKTSHIETMDGVKQAAPVYYGFGLFDHKELPDPASWPVSGIDSSFTANGGLELAERAGRFSNDEEVWEELLANDKAMVVDNFFLQEIGGPSAQLVKVGDIVPVINPITGEENKRSVIGVTASDNAFAGSYMSQESIEAALAESTAPSRFYVDTVPSADEQDVADRIQGRLVSSGAEASTMRAIVEDSLSISLQFLQLMQGYLALGLLVGIAGLGVVMVRAVRERRREVGVLRSLGFIPGRVREAFILESGFVALQGILIGAVLALVTASQLVANGDFGEGLVFEVPWVQLAVLCSSTLIASLLATAWPAQQASKIAPAVALRIAD
jgi:putative ABC transport system permease protein